MAWFYFFAGFWKLNTSFLDHRYSCASVHFAQSSTRTLHQASSRPTRDLAITAAS